MPVDHDDAHLSVEAPSVEPVRAAYRARASAHSGCPQSRSWSHHGTTSVVEQELQTKICSLPSPGSFPGMPFAAWEGRRAGPAGRVVYLAVLPGARRSGPPHRRFPSPLTCGAGPSGIGSSSSSSQSPGRLCERPAISLRCRSFCSRATRQGRAAPRPSR
jgi:hypothetical protein